MPELPEITQLARQMQAHVVGKTIAGVDVLQPKCLNLPVAEFAAALTGAEIVRVTNRGKWVVAETTRGWLLVNLGMGGELWLTERSRLPEKHRIIIDFTDGSCLSINFWWFGYTHYATPEGLAQHAMVSKLGRNALDVTAGELKTLIAGRRGGLKSFLLDQSNLAGIGNAYIHDILFLARLHPLRRLESLSDAEIAALAQAIQDGLRPSLDQGGASYETDLFGNKGGFSVEQILIGYREGQPCPRCGTPIEKLKTGSTTGFICPSCQPLSK